MRVSQNRFGRRARPCYTARMSRSSALVWATFAAIIGGGGLIYLLTTISPCLADGAQNLPAVVGFFGACFLLLAGIASVAALALHERIPLLAGITRRQPGAVPAPEVAIRQCVLLSLALCFAASFAYGR